MENITVILHEPEHPGNIGAVARVMKNFGFSKLVLVSPKCMIDEEMRARAKHAQDVIDAIKIVKKIPPFDLLVGTTAKVGSDYNIPRAPLSPRNSTKKIPKQNKVGILFGSEGCGLSNEIIESCDFIISIPASNYQTLNLSHAAAIILYELSQNQYFHKRIDPAGRTEYTTIEKLMNEVLDSVSFATADKKETQKKVWKRVFGKSSMTKREAFAIMGLLKKIVKKR